MVVLRPHLHARHPLHPLEPPPVGGDEPGRRAVAVREALTADPRREQRVFGLVKREAPAVPRDRREPDVGRLAVGRLLVAGGRLRPPGRVEQVADADPAPLLHRVPPARAVEQGFRLVAGTELVGGQLDRIAHEPLDPQSVPLPVDRVGVVGDPRCDRERAVPVAPAGLGPGEPPVRAGRVEQVVDALLEPVGRGAGGQQDGVSNGGAPALEVDPPREPEPGRGVRRHEREQDQSEPDVNREQRPVGEPHVDAGHPDDPGRERAERGDERQDRQGGRPSPPARLREPAPDARELPREQDDDREPERAVEPEDGPPLRDAHREGDEPRQDLRGDEREQRPVDRARRRL